MRTPEERLEEANTRLIRAQQLRARYLTALENIARGDHTDAGLTAEEYARRVLSTPLDESVVVEHSDGTVHVLN